MKIKPAWLLAILTGLNLFNYIDRYLLNGVLTPIQQEFGLTDAQLGRLNTAFMVGYFFTSPFFGYLGDRRSRKALIALGVGIGSLGTMATSWAPTIRFAAGSCACSWGWARPATPRCAPA